MRNVQTHTDLTEQDITQFLEEQGATDKAYDTGTIVRALADHVDSMDASEVDSNSASYDYIRNLLNSCQDQAFVEADHEPGKAIKWKLTSEGVLNNARDLDLDGDEEESFDPADVVPSTAEEIEEVAQRETHEETQSEDEGQDTEDASEDDEDESEDAVTAPQLDDSDEGGLIDEIADQAPDVEASDEDGDEDEEQSERKIGKVERQRLEGPEELRDRSAWKGMTDKELFDHMSQKFGAENYKPKKEIVSSFFGYTIKSSHPAYRHVTRILWNMERKKLVRRTKKGRYIAYAVPSEGWPEDQTPSAEKAQNAPS